MPMIQTTAEGEQCVSVSPYAGDPSLFAVMRYRAKPRRTDGVLVWHLMRTLTVAHVTRETVARWAVEIAYREGLAVTHGIRHGDEAP